MTDGKAKTLTGIPLGKVMDELNAELPPEAYKAVPHRTYLTDTNPAYMREVVTRVFGMCGYGWFYNYETDHIVITEGKDSKGNPEHTVIIKRLWLRFRYITQDGRILISEAIPAAGGSKNTYLEDALKGAITNCLGKAFSMLCWQLDVYKGLRNGKSKKKTTTKKKPPAKKPSADDWATHIGPDEMLMLANWGAIKEGANVNHYVALLNLTPFKPGDELKPEWFKHYREAREDDKSSKEAADIATKALGA